MTTSFPGATAIARVAATRAAEAVKYAILPTVVTYFNAKAASTTLERKITTSREVDNKSSREYHRNIRRGVAGSVREAKVIY
jgi:hypothetical protein